MSWNRVPPGRLSASAIPRRSWSPALADRNPQQQTPQQQNQTRERRPGQAGQTPQADQGDPDQGGLGDNLNREQQNRMDR